MTLQGIDVASYQKGIDLSKVPCDFAIIKATEGTSYVNPACNAQYASAKGAGKLLGLYHYVKGNDAVAEANFFIDSIKNYVGSAILCIDWESGGNSAWGNMDYLRQLCQQVIARTGVRPLIYVQASAYAPVSAVAKELNCGLWIAQYASMAATGYQAHPWNEGKYACAIRQYSSTGRLPGWGGSLDLNIAYMDANAWRKYANPSGAPAPAPAPKPADPLAGKTDAQLADEVIAGRFGVGDARKRALGGRYNAVQAIVNQRLGGGHRGRTYTVRRGDTLSGIASRYGTSWQALARKNGIANANRIFPGQVIRID